MNLSHLDSILLYLLQQTRARTTSQSNQWIGHCPAHEDKTPSLSIRAEDKILLYCHAGCSLEAILYALGLEISDLFP